MSGGSTKQCGALFCLTFCLLLYPIRKDKTGTERERSEDYGAGGSSVDKFLYSRVNFLVGEGALPLLVKEKGRSKK
jgi:hypothetical protein